MANFDTGVASFVFGRATIVQGFPVDFRGNAEIACKHCNFYVRATQRCGITQQIVNYPNTNVGECCPLERIEENEV